MKSREILGDRVIRKIGEYASNVPGSIIARQVLTPLDLERTYGLTEGNIFHGDLTLGAVVLHAASSGLVAVSHSDRWTLPVRAGAHPGGRSDRGSGHNAAQQTLRDWKKGRFKESAA